MKLTEGEAAARKQDTTGIIFPGTIYRAWDLVPTTHGGELHRGKTAVIAMPVPTRGALVAIWEYSFRQFGVVQANEYVDRIAAVFDMLVTQDIGKRRPAPGENICSLPVAQHMICFGPSHSVITIIRLLGQTQDTPGHVPDNRYGIFSCAT